MKVKTVLITGGSSGIGKACARLYASKGYRLVITGRNAERLQATAQEIMATGVEVLAQSVDAADEEGAKQVVQKTIEKFGRLDVLICNAGVSMRALFDTLDLQVFRDVMDINLMGAVNYVKYALPHLIASKGTMVGVSSINGQRGTPARTAYTASKFAMEGFFEALRTEVMHHGVHVFVIRPGFTNTNIRNTALTARGKAQGQSPREESKMMSAEQVAHYIYKGCVKKKRNQTLTSLGRWLIFLNHLIPSRMDKIVYSVLAKERDSPLKK